MKQFFDSPLAGAIVAVVWCGAILATMLFLGQLG